MNISFKMKMEFLTPCFLGGADPNNQGEFRLEALKSLSRYWWRQFQDQSDSLRMFEKESKIFGSTENRSKFLLYELDRSQLTFDNSGSAYKAPRGSEQSYLFYSCVGRGPKQPGRRRWITEGSKVSFAMHFVGAEEKQIKETLLSLWLLQTFGGLGSRSRRGAGSFQIDVEDCPKDMKQSLEKLFGSTAEDLVRAIQGEERDNWFNLIDESSPIYRALANPNHFRRFGQKKSANEVLDELGKKMRDFRSCFTYNPGNFSLLHRQAAALHSAGISNRAYSGPNPIEKTVFGLPIICNFKRRDSTGKLVRDCQGRPTFENWQIVLRPESQERRASPLFISVKRDKKGLYYANLLILWEEFLPQGERIAIVKKQRNREIRLGYVSVPTVTALEDFLRRLP